MPANGVVETVEAPAVEKVGADPEDLLTKAQLAARLSVSSRTITSYVAQGMPRYKVNQRMTRYRWPAVLSWIETHGRV
jgi:phage terminase Nu1 subunit (DNA packaging protein)